MISRLRACGLSPDDLQGPDDLHHFPTLSRTEWGNAWRDLPIHPPEPLWVAVPSSGSTGAPVQVVKSAFDQVHMWAVLDFLIVRRQLTRSTQVALLCTLPSGMEYDAALPMFHEGHLHRISTQRARPWERLAALPNPILFTDPAGLHWLLAQSPLRPTLVLSSASHLSPSVRQASEAHFQCPVVDYYATTEVGAIAATCGEQRLHVLAPEVFVESIEGELVVSRLRSSAIPILRYRTGDSGRVAWISCRCGQNGWVIADFSGRHACWFTNPAGAQIDAWQLAWLFKHHALTDFRVTQDSTSQFTIELVGTAKPNLQEHLYEALFRMGWVSPSLSFHTCEAIPRSGSKASPFRTMVSPPSP